MEVIMKAKFFFHSLLFFILIASSGYCQIKSNNIVIGTIDTVHSSLLNENRPIWVHVPCSGQNNIYSPTRYPVIYLLDGDGHFDYVVGMIHQLSQINGNTICPEMIVVGIPNTDRTRDLTPTHMKPNAQMDSNFVKTSGGGEKFISFIEKELIPHIDSLYPTAPYRMLIGHSFGGLTVVYTLLNHSNLFNSYLAIDPSLWCDNQLMLRQAQKFLDTEELNGKRLYVAMANTLPQNEDTSQIRTDTSLAKGHPVSILEFIDLLRNKSKNGLISDWKYYDQDNHGSVPLIATYDALHFFFDFYRLPSFAVFLDSLTNTDSLLTAYSDRLSENMGYKILPQESLVNALAYNFLTNRMLSKAFSLFEMNIKNYPKSFNVYDSMGDYYSAISNKEKAIDYYEKALTLKDYPETRGKLEKLKQRK
jgi:predicted alpha/beta superfamily hydrolase